MTTRPGYVWSSATNEWIEIGPIANTGSTVFYQASQPVSAGTGDIWIDADDEVPGITSSLNYRWRRIATGGETSLSGNDSSGLPLAYNPGYEQVYLNGVLLYRGDDYTATTGTTITGLTALVVGDTIEVLSFVTAPIGDTYTQAAADGKFVSAVNNGMFLVKPTSVTGGTVSANGQITIGTAVSSVVVNGAFSATYDNYKIIVDGGVCSTNTSFNLQIGSSTSGYYYAAHYSQYTTTTPLALGSTTGSSFVEAGRCATAGINMSVEVFNPFLTRRTGFRGASTDYDVAGYIISTNGFLNDTTSHTSFTVKPSSGTITGGTIRIYGYNNGA
jgi:hypothetical protein